MGVQGIDTQTQLSRPLLLSCRIRLPCVDKVYTRSQAEPGPTRLLPNHLELSQTNEHGQCTPTGRYRPSTHQEDCCLPHGTHKPNDRCQLFHHQPAASRLMSRKSFMRTVTPPDSSAGSSRLQLWKDSLTDIPSKWDWRWQCLCRLDLERTGSVGDPHRGEPCENNGEEMGLSRRRPVGGLRLRGSTYDGPLPLLAAAY